MVYVTPAANRIACRRGGVLLRVFACVCVGAAAAAAAAVAAVVAVAPQFASLALRMHFALHSAQLVVTCNMPISRGGSVIRA